MVVHFTHHVRWVANCHTLQKNHSHKLPGERLWNLYPNALNACIRCTLQKVIDQFLDESNLGA